MWSIVLYLVIMQISFLDVQPADDFELIQNLPERTELWQMREVRRIGPYSLGWGTPPHSCAGSTPLKEACRAEDLKQVEELIAKGLKKDELTELPEPREDRPGEWVYPDTPPLFIALEKKNHQLIRLLVQA